MPLHKKDQEASLAQPLHESGHLKDIKVSRHSDKIFKGVLFYVTLFVLLILGGIFVTLIVSSGESFKRFGLRFLASDAWDDRMTLARDLKIVSAPQGQEDLIVVPFSFFLELDSILPGENLILRDSEGDMSFSWIVHETNEKQILIYPERKLINKKKYQILALDSIKDQNAFPLAYSYRFMITIDRNQPNGYSELKVFDVKSHAEIGGDEEQDMKWYGAVSFVAGTLLSSILALLISLPFSLAIAIFLGEYYTKGPLSTLMQTTNELLAGIPSIIYGAWAFFFIVPLMSRWFPQSASGGAGILTAAIVLAVMIIPYTASMAREVIKLVPNDIKEAAYGMGATRFAVIRRIILPYAASGIFAGVLLSFGRALGETMAVTMVIGNKNSIPKSILDGGQTIASLIANEYGEAGSLKLSSLTELGLILFVITLVFGILGRLVIKKLSFKDET